MERVLVTGGTGFFGKHLVKRLMSCRKPVRVIARLLGNGASPNSIANQIATAMACKVQTPSMPIPLAMGIASLLEAFSVIPSKNLPLTRSRVRYLTENRVYSGARAEVELGFKPSINLEDGLQRTVQWYQNGGLL
jgi:nucleoside-diphosphate-sugar epimerase